jgi:hypothetical protein
MKKKTSGASVQHLCAFVLFLATAMTAAMAHGEPNELLAEAIKGATRLQGSLPTKERLAVYETIFDALDQIVQKHPSSNQAIQILSGQQIGDFDPTALRSTYIGELTSYYDTVCEASPSYSCLGFVSLKTGNEQCAIASDFEDIVDAHASLKNAAKVFGGQKDSRSYVSLALNSYRGCLMRSSFDATTFASDFFASELLDLLLASDQMSLARASIEDMETPYFKFLGALRLSEHQNRPFDRPFFDRMKKYIEDRIPPWEGNSKMANYALLLSAIRRSSFPISYQDASSAADHSSNWGRLGESLSCDQVFSLTIFDLLSTLQAELIGLDEGRSRIGDFFAQGLLEWHADAAQPVLLACEADGLYNYYLMTILHGHLLLDDLRVAAEFKQRSLKESFSNREQLEFFFDHFGVTEEKLALLGPHDLGENPTPRINAEYVLGLQYSRYLVFEKRVDFGDVCEASRLLFQELKGGDDFDSAIEYMINSPKIDPTMTYNCGDEDLELLLQ